MRQRFGSLLQRFDALAALLPDPRAAAILTAFVGKSSIPGIDQEELFERLLGTVVDAGDPRQLAPLEAAAKEEPWKRKSDRQYFSVAIPAAIAALKKVRGQPPQAHQPAEAPEAAHHEMPDRLLEAVLKAPGDDAPRLVLADWLMERGAPRGEFIALQVRGAKKPLSAAEVTKMNALERAHRADWLGPLARALTGCTWSRGFLAEASLSQNARAPTPVWKEAYRHPALELVTRLELGAGNARHYVGFLRGGRLLSLEERWIPDSARRLLARPVR